MKRSMERSKTLSGELRERYEQFCEDVGDNMTSIARVAIEQMLDKYGY